MFHFSVQMGGSLWSFPISKLAVGAQSFSQEKQNKSPNLWDCLSFSPSDSTHLGRDTSNHGVTLELLTLEFYLNFISILFRFQLWDLI